MACIPLLVSEGALYRYDLIMLFVIAGIGLSVSVGFAGEQLMGQAVIAGVAAYAAALLSIHLGWSPAETLPLVLLFALATQLITSLPGLKVRGLYLGLVSFFGVLVFQDLTIYFTNLTGGSAGLYGVQPLVANGQGTADQMYTFEVILGFAILVFLGFRNLVRSSWGLRLRALRDAPVALEAAGVSLTRTKLMAYGLTAIPTGIAGWALAYLDQSVESTEFSVTFTLILFAGVQLIAPGSLYGPILGVGILEGYSQLIGPFSQWNVVGLGILLSLVVTLRNSGVMQTPRARRVLEVSRVPQMMQFLTDRVRPISTVPDQVPSVTHDSATTSLDSGTQLLNPHSIMSAEVLEVREAIKVFGEVRAVDGVSLNLRSNRVVALMGENGSGKTTLVNLISGFLKPTGGTIKLGGKDIRGMSARSVANLGCARTFQLPNVIVDATLVENVEVGLLRDESSHVFAALFRPVRIKRTNQRRRDLAEEVCRMVGLSGEELRAGVNKVPLGLRRLAEVARAVATKPWLLCLDEPAVGLDHAELERLSTLLRDLAASGRAVLVVAHDGRFVLDTCDDVLLMRRGKLVGHFTDVSPMSLPAELGDYFRHLPHLREKAVT